MLAVIITIVRTSLFSGDVQSEVLETLVNRLHGMARAYSLLSERSWNTVGLRDIIQEELAPFANERIRLSGPNVDLQPSQALAVSMVVHELATNASKYGALSNDGGILDVRWSSSEGRLSLDWSERDGPRTDAPKEDGFGYALIRGQIERQLAGTLEAEFKPEGLSLRMAFSL